MMGTNQVNNNFSCISFHLKSSEIDQTNNNSYGVSFLHLENAEGDVIKLPTYTILLNEDLLNSLPIKELRNHDELKIESQHGLRKFKIWYCNFEAARRVLIEEFKNNRWELVHSYQAL